MLARLLKDERVRFLLIGGFNTVFGYALFVLFQFLWGDTAGYLVSLYVSYVISILVAFVLHRRFTFQVRGTANIWTDFVRFVGVYLVALAINTIALPLLVEVAGLDPLIAQAIVVVVTTVLSYVGHKFFSFRRAKPPTPDDEGSAETP